MEEAAQRKIPVFKRVRYAIEGFGLGALAHTMTFLPRPAALAVGRAIGMFGYLILPRDRRVAHANVNIVFGDEISKRQKQHIVRSGYRNLGATLMGLAWGSRRLNSSNLQDWVEMSPESAQSLQELKKSGRGFIFVTPHYGDWELTSLAAGYLGFPFMAVAEPVRNPWIEKLISRLRTSSGHTIIQPRFAAVKLYKHLARGGSVAMIADVNGRRNRGGVWLDFFGLPVFNGSALVELALRAEAAIIFVYSEPISNGRVRMVIEPEIEISQTGDRVLDVKETYQRCLDRCAALIKRAPDHWMWTYKRWKRRPTPEVGKYPFYSKYDART